MFWADKQVTTQRINSSGIFENNITMKCRYEPKKFTSMRELETKQKHITYTLYSDVYDLVVRDKVIHDSKNFIVWGTYEYSDSLWKHLEVIMLQNDTIFHEDITIDKLSLCQPNYDAVMWEWIWPKIQETRTIKALVDSAKLLKGQFIKMIPWWKLEDTELVATIFFPESIEKEDKIVYNENTYEVKWIIPFPHYLAVWINKYIKDYDN